MFLLCLYYAIRMSIGVYEFPAIKGLQAGRAFYTSQCPVRLLPRLFLFDDVDLPVEHRAQRTINKQRLPEIARYILDNRDSFVFSAITASIDAEVEFIADKGDSGRLGTLRIPLDARFVINDGQHRRAALELALADDPSLGDETIAVVFFVDIGLKKSQQMFADLNRYAVKPSASIGVLYDHREPLAAQTREIVSKVPLLRDLVEPEKTTLAVGSRKLFTLSAVNNTHKILFAGVESEDPTVLAMDFWTHLSEAFPEWTAVLQRQMLAGEVRGDFIHSHGTVLNALGHVVNSLARKGPINWKKIVQGLGNLDWSRSNAALWEGRALIGGRVSKSHQNVLLTSAVIKREIGLELNPEEEKLDQAFRKGQNNG